MTERTLSQIIELADRSRVIGIMSQPEFKRLGAAARALVGGCQQFIELDVFRGSFTFDIEGPYGCISITVNPS